jgi:hypothetical protein
LEKRENLNKDNYIQKMPKDFQILYDKVNKLKRETKDLKNNLAKNKKSNKKASNLPENKKKT